MSDKKVSKNIIEFIILFLFGFLIFAWNTSFSNVRLKNLESENYVEQITQFDQIKISKFHHEGKAILFVDIDDVLITPADLVLRSCDKKNPFKIIEKLRRSIRSGNVLERENALELLGILRMLRKVKLVEKNIPLYLDYFHSLGLDLVGITQIGTGKCGQIPSVERWRIKELKGLGINFAKLNKISIDLADMHTLTNHPNFVEGIIFTDHLSKGECIKAFLKKKPIYKTIYLVDDQLKNIKDTFDHLKDSKIIFKGFHYIVAKKIPGIVNLKVGQLQYEMLFNHKKWLDDYQAQKLLESENKKL